MKMAIVLNSRLTGDHPFKDQGMIIDAMCERYEVVVYGKEPALRWGNFPFVVMSPELETVAYWKRSNVRIAIVYTFLSKGTTIMKAMREAGIYVIAKTESDGKVAHRTYPFETLFRMWIVQPTITMKLRATLHWLRLYLFAPNDEKVFGSMDLADTICFESKASGVNARKILTRFGKPEVADRFCSVTIGVRPEFTSQPISSIRNGVVALGSWHVAQKGGKKIVRVLDYLLKERPETTVTIVGREGQGLFRELVSQHRNATYLGHIGPVELASLFARSQFLVSTSYFESGGIAVHESLCCGCSIVAAPADFFRDFSKDHVSVSDSWAARTIADTALAELARWEKGERDPEAISSYWRERLQTHKVIDAHLARAKAAGFGPAKDAGNALSEVSR